MRHELTKHITLNRQLNFGEKRRFVLRLIKRNKKKLCKLRAKIYEIAK